MSIMIYALARTSSIYTDRTFFSINGCRISHLVDRNIFYVLFKVYRCIFDWQWNRQCR